MTYDTVLIADHEFLIVAAGRAGSPVPRPAATSKTAAPPGG